MSSNLGSSNSSNEQYNNYAFQPAPVAQPWYPDVRNHVFNNERRPGRLTKREKKSIQASFLPVLANSDNGKDYCEGGKYAKPVAQLDAEYAEQVLEEKACREQEKREKMEAFAALNGHTATARDNGTVFAASAAGSSSGSANAESAAGNGRGTGRLSYGGMRGVGRARGCSGR